MNVIDLTLQGHTILKVNGQLMGEFLPAFSLSRDNLLEEVKKARASVAALKWLGQILTELEEAADRHDHNFTSGAAKREKFAKGLEDGLRKVTVPYPAPVSMDGVPSVIPNLPPESTPSYLRGYDLGMAIARAVEICQENDVL